MAAGNDVVVAESTPFIVDSASSALRPCAESLSCSGSWSRRPVATERLKLNRKTVGRLYHLMHQVIAQRAEARVERLDGLVENDEFYFVGYRKRKRG